MARSIHDVARGTPGALHANEALPRELSEQAQALVLAKPGRVRYLRAREYSSWCEEGVDRPLVAVEFGSDIHDGQRYGDRSVCDGEPRLDVTSLIAALDAGHTRPELLNDVQAEQHVAQDGAPEHRYTAPEVVVLGHPLRKAAWRGHLDMVIKHRDFDVRVHIP